MKSNHVLRQPVGIIFPNAQPDLEPLEYSNEEHEVARAQGELYANGTVFGLCQMYSAPEEVPGVYSLLEGSKVVFIGMTPNLRATISLRLRDGFFSAYAVTPLPDVSPKELVEITVASILNLRPRDNKTLPPNTLVATAETLVSDYGVDKELLGLFIAAEPEHGREFQGKTYYVVEEIIHEVNHWSIVNTADRRV